MFLLPVGLAGLFLELSLEFADGCLVGHTLLPLALQNVGHILQVVLQGSSLCLVLVDDLDLFSQ